MDLKFISETQKGVGFKKYVVNISMGLLLLWEENDYDCVLSFYCSVTFILSFKWNYNG